MSEEKADFESCRSDHSFKIACFEVQSRKGKADLASSLQKQIPNALHGAKGTID
jgi:hypothetical protein